MKKSFKKKNSKCKILAFDHTVNKKFWIKRFKKDFISFLLLKRITPNQIINIFKYLEYINFFSGKNKHYLKKIAPQNNDKVNQITISQAIGNNKNIVLKIDIEGDEYKVLNEIDKNFNKINLVVIEFHKLQKNLKKIKSFIKKTKLKNIHININNYGKLDGKGIPSVIEMTLINPKKFKIKNKKTKRNYPITGLDYKNHKRGDDIKVVFDEK